MIKFLQWSLVTVVAIVLIVALVGQILAHSTGRAREASVAVLKEKLARLEGDRTGERVVDIAPSEANSAAVPLGQVAQTGGSDLRVRWMTLFDELSQTWMKCGFEPPVLHRVVFEEAFEVGDSKLDAAQQQALSDYRACIAPTAETLMQLLEETEISGGLFKFTVRPDNDIDEKLWMCGSLLNQCFWIDAYHENYPGMLDAYTGSVKFSRLTYVRTTPWTFEPSVIWKFLDKTMVAETIDPARWDRLLEVLESRRTQEFFLEDVRRDTEGVVFAFETWKDSDDWGFRFSDDPIGYMRTWAYPRLTPALFDHDFDRFNRAMDRLLDLANKPYFEIKDDLAQFCEEFDVEPDIESLKFTRSNPGWYYVLELSRHGLQQNARNQASIDVIRFAILLEKHRRESGSYPESLAVFAEALGGSLPLNPLMGDAYVYERDGESFRLGFRQETHPDRVEVGLEATSVTWWHDPLGVEEDFE